MPKVDECFRILEWLTMKKTLLLMLTLLLLQTKTLFAETECPDMAKDVLEITNHFGMKQVTIISQSDNIAKCEIKFLLSKQNQTFKITKSLKNQYSLNALVKENAVVYLPDYKTVYELTSNIDIQVIAKKKSILLKMF